MPSTNLSHRLTAQNAEGFTREQIGVVQGERSRFAGLRNQFMNDVQNIGGEQQRFGAAAGQQAFQVLRDQGAGVTAGSTLNRGLRVAKARQGVMNRGESAIRNQRLKDRLQLARTGMGRKGQALRLQSLGQQIRSGVDIGVQGAKDASRASTAGLIGTGLGAAAGVLRQNKLNNDSYFDFGKKNPDPFDVNTLSGDEFIGAEFKPQPGLA